MILLEIAPRGFGFKTKRVIDRWLHGLAPGTIDLTPEVMADLKRTVTQPQYHVYRGWKLHDEEDVQDTLGFQVRDHEPTVPMGSNVNVRLYNSWSSWTLSPDMAKLFANLKYDTIHHMMYDPSEITDLGHDQDELLGYGAITEMIVPAEHVIADLSHMTRGQMHEQEILVAPGTYSAKLLSFQGYWHDEYEDWGDDENDDDDGDY